MKRTALALLLALAAPAGAQQLKDGAMAVEQNESLCAQWTPTPT